MVQTRRQLRLLPLLSLSSMRTTSSCRKHKALVLLEDEGFERHLVVPPPFAAQPAAFGQFILSLRALSRCNDEPTLVAE
jgi:hypothetical protein